MKTSELRKWLDEKGWYYTEDENFILLGGSFARVVVYKKAYRIDFKESSILSERSLELYKKFIEYYETPPSEREDEKKYYFEFGDKIDKKDKKRYLNLNTSSNGFFFHHDWEDVEDLEEGGISFKGEFTQQEIDDFPQEIKGAIECGFLRKMEVDT